MPPRKVKKKKRRVPTNDDHHEHGDHHAAAAGGGAHHSSSSPSQSAAPAVPTTIGRSEEPTSTTPNHNSVNGAASSGSPPPRRASAGAAALVQSVRTLGGAAASGVVTRKKLASSASQSSSAFRRDGLLSSTREDTSHSEAFRASFRTTVRDVVMEDSGGLRELTITQRHEGEEEPMGRKARKQLDFERRMNAVLGRAGGGGGEEDGGDGGGPKGAGDAFHDNNNDEEQFVVPPNNNNKGDDNDQQQKHTYYNLSSRPARRQTCLTQCLNWFGLQQLERLNIANDKFMIKYLQWSFRTSFFGLFLSQLMVFFTMVMIFAGLILAAGRSKPDCIEGGDYRGNSAWADAFALSWTTFSTVGYGHTYPSLGAQYADKAGMTAGECWPVGFLASMESFVGVLYAGFCGAIFFGKVLRIQSKAQVTFSDAVTVRFGDGVECYDDDDEGSAAGIEDIDEDDDGDGAAPELSVLNDTGPTSGLGGMRKVSSLVSLASLESAGGTTHLPRRRVKRIPCPVIEFRVANNDYAVNGGEIIDANLNVIAGFWDDVINRRAARQTLRQESEPASKRVPKRVLRPVLIEVREHPFFKSVWYARHTLDEDSPLLTPAVRGLVEKNENYWPAELNNWRGVRDSLAFDQILVNLSGVSNLSANSVYEQKVFGRGDVVVGYQFARCLYRGDDGAVNVDMHLINDLFEQFGGGGEPLVK